MKKLLPLLFVSLFLSPLSSSAQRFEWLKIYSSSGFSTGDQYLEVSDNNVYVTGEFQGALSFGSTVLNSGTTRNIYLASYDTLGNFQWAVQNSGGSTFNDIVDIDVDSAGNIYLLGFFNTSIQWGGITLNASNTFSFREAFIVKFNKQGVSQWIRGIYSPNASFSFRGVADLSISPNKIFIAGQQINDIQYSGSSIRLNQSGGGGTFSQNNVFVGELDHNGNPLSLNRIATANSSTSNFNTLGDIEALNDSVFYFAALYRGQYSFGTNNVNFPNSTSTLLGITKFTNYNCDWLVRPSSSTSGFSSIAPQIAVAKNGDLYLAANASGNLTIQNNTITPPPNFPSFIRYIYALKVNTLGQVQNFVNFNAANNVLSDVDLNAKSEFIISGEFRDSVDINGVKTFPNGSFSGDHLILKLDSNLNAKWYQTGGGGNADQALSIASDEGKTSFYVSGNFRGLSQFGTTFFTGNTSFSTSILYKMDDCGSNPVPITFSGDTNLCVGDNVRIIANPPTNATFQWLRDSVQLAGEVFRDLLVNTEGNYQVIVNGSGCLDTSRVIRVNVDSFPMVSFNLNDTVCEQDAPITLSGGSPAGGVYKGPGVVGNTFDPSLTGIGTVQIRYVFANGGCADSATSTIFVKPAPTVFFAPLSNVCITSLPITLTNAFPFGGTFSGNGVTGNQFDPASAGGGFTDITYTYTDANGCVGTAIQTIEVDTLPSVSFNSVPDLCSNTSYTLTEGVPSGGVYSGPGVVGGQFDPSLTGTGTFTINYTLTNQCGTSSASQNITVIPSPTVILGSFSDLCEGDPAITLSGGSPSGGAYSGTGVSSGNFNPTVSGVGTFTIFYDFTAANGCTSRDSSSITVNPLPVTSITPNSSICLGGSINLTATGGSTYQWSTSATGSTISVSPSTTTNYSVTITSADGCSQVENTIVTVNPLPTATITGTNVICEGDNTTLTASGGQSFLWSNSSTASSINVAPTTSTTYSVTVTDANGCTDIESETVTVNPLPNVTLASFADLCEADAAITLSGGSPTGGTYSGIGVSSGSFDPSVAGVGTFTIFYDYTDANGCSARDSSNITVNPFPTTSITADSDICLGSSISLTASGGGSYLWNTSATTASINVSPSITTNYSVTITSAAGCSQVENVTVTVNPLPTATISGINAICAGSSTTLTANGGQSYLWSNSSSAASITVSPTNTTTYTVTVTDANGCTDTENETVTVNPLPIVSLGTFADLCEGDAAIILSGGSPSGGTYSGIGVSSGSFDPSIAGVGTFTIFYDFTNAIGCSSRDSSTITVNPLPNGGVSQSPTICQGSSTTLTATGGASYLWSNSASTPSITVSPTSTTNYSVTITSVAGCSDVKTVSVVVNPLPTASISGTTSICNGSNTTLTAAGGQSYLWSNSSTNPSITVSPNTTTTYSVTVTDANGCTDTESETITVNPLPNVSLGSFLDLCEGDAAITLSGGSPAGGTYSGTGVSSGIFDPAVSGAGTFTIFYDFTDAIGCSARDSSTITVNPAPNSSISPDTAICEGSNVNLVATGGTNYLWSNAATTASINVSPTVTTNYFVTITSANSCAVVDSVEVTVNSLPAISTSSDTLICLGDSVPIGVSGSASNFLWSTNETSAIIVVSPLSTAYYTVVLTDPLGCTATDSVLVTVSTGSPINIGPDTILDPINTTSYTYDAGLGFVSYLWNDNTSAQTLTVNYDPAKAGTTDTISVIAGNNSGCPSVDTALVFYDFPSGIASNGNELSSILVSPNPTTDVINIQFSKRIESSRRLQVFDLKGKIVIDELFNGNEDLISIDLLDTKINKGVYLLNIEENGQYYREKIVVQ
jgi:predicted transcriptional regulator